ncbi:MAG: mechanosensitive ion channel, partial [Myxococcales bacterium]|nr:mechanosensitive ion channel [Myxococcales bacterium]
MNLPFADGMQHPTIARRAPAFLLLSAVLLFATPGFGQVPVGLPGSDADAAEASVPDAVAVDPSASDAAITRRLTRILDSTGWFREAEVAVDSGVVFLSGEAESELRRSWAGDLARQTEAVVAVVNRMEVPTRSPWDPALLRAELGGLLFGFQRAVPYLFFAAVILFLSALGARLAGSLTRRSLRQRIQTVLLLDLVARAVGLVVFLLGFYLVLRVSGLTRLAMTLIGGTGVAALVVGIAFRDIMENFLASLLISLRRPFSVGDVVEISGHTGVVQKVTTRGTLLMSFDGNHIQVPNATVYKSQIVNYTANPKRRMEFVVGIGYDDDLAAAQATA